MNIPSSLKIRTCMLDVDDFFGLSSASSQRMKLDAYAFGVGLDPKTMDGSGVADLYKSMLMGSDSEKTKAMEDLQKYNERDTDIVKQLAGSYYISVDEIVQLKGWR